MDNYQAYILILFGIAGFAVNISVMVRWFLKLENRLTTLEVKQKVIADQIKKIIS